MKKLDSDLPVFLIVMTGPRMSKHLQTFTMLALVSLLIMVVGMMGATRMVIVISPPLHPPPGGRRRWRREMAFLRAVVMMLVVMFRARWRWRRKTRWWRRELSMMRSVMRWRRWGRKSFREAISRMWRRRGRRREFPFESLESRWGRRWEETRKRPIVMMSVVSVVFVLVSVLVFVLTIVVHTMEPMRLIKSRMKSVAELPVVGYQRSMDILLAEKKESNERGHDQKDRVSGMLLGDRSRRRHRDRNSLAQLHRWLIGKLRRECLGRQGAIERSGGVHGASGAPLK
jgi:hypothetical protein